MKFTDFNQSIWNETSAYYDTCVIPYSGLTGNETPPRVVQLLSGLKERLEWIEVPFKGRVITYPALQYCFEGFSEFTNYLINNLRSVGFKFVILVVAPSVIIKQECAFDLVIDDRNDDSAKCKEEILQLWRKDVSNL